MNIPEKAWHNMTNAKRIDIVDDDAAVRDALGIVFEVEGFSVRRFDNGASFMNAAVADPPSVVLLDVHMPGKSGMDLLKDLARANFPAPVFIISGQGDIPMAVQAIKDGAFDFIEKPFVAQTVVDCVNNALAVAGRDKEPVIDSDFPGKDTLTPREIEVLGQISSGLSNKEAARTLGISPRTIEVHRARIMEKIGARNAADLVRIVMSSS